MKRPAYLGPDATQAQRLAYADEWRKWRAEEQRRQGVRDSVRKPPRPAFEHVGGVCSLCGGPLPGRRRSWCSDECVAIWNTATSPTMGSLGMWGLHGACFECGDQGPLDVDHVRPLWSLNAEERLELKWWLPFNLQLLCDACHRAKTRYEASVRAAYRRAGRLPASWPPADVEQLELVAV